MILLDDVYFWRLLSHELDQKNCKGINFISFMKAIFFTWDVTEFADAAPPAPAATVCRMTNSPSGA